MAEFIVPDNVRDYLTVTGVTGQWSNAVIGSNIAAASGNLQRWTNRQFEVQGSNSAVTKKFTTHGRAFLVIPDLQRADLVRLDGVTLTEDTSFWLVPDRHQTGVFVGIELLPRRAAYTRRPDRFDVTYPRYRYDTLPNDLVITGVWGHEPYPSELLHATTVLAAYYTKRPDAVLGGVSLTPQGNEIDLSQLPREVADFIRDWKLDDPMVSV